MKIYVASSWRNNRQPEVVRVLRSLGHTVYDFKNPEPRTGFAWREIDPNWQSWGYEQYLSALQHERAEEGFRSDMHALSTSDICVLVLPCGRSAHLELGYAVGIGLQTAILLDDVQQNEPELMYKMVGWIGTDLDKLGRHLSPIQSAVAVLP